MKVYKPEDVYRYAIDGDIDNLRLALDYGNNSFDWYSDEYGNTALHVAAVQGHTACIGVLLDRGADIKIKTNQGLTALHIAAHQSHTVCIGVLLDRGADAEIKTNQGATALHLATQRGHTECIGVLLDRGADIESKESQGFTALHVATDQGHIECTRLLLDRQAVIDEDKIDDIPHPETKQMILDEILHRLRRAAFDLSLIHI